MSLNDRVLKAAKRYNLLRLHQEVQGHLHEREEKLWEQLPLEEQEALQRMFSHLLNYTFPDFAPSRPALNINRVMHLEQEVMRLERELSELADLTLKLQDDQHWIPSTRPPPHIDGPKTFFGGWHSKIVLGLFRETTRRCFGPNPYVAECLVIYFEDETLAPAWALVDSDGGLDCCETEPTHWHPMPLGGT